MINKKEFIFLLLLCVLISAAGLKTRPGLLPLPERQGKEISRPQENSPDLGDSLIARTIGLKTEKAIREGFIVFQVFVNPVQNIFQIHFKPALDGLLEIKFVNEQGDELQQIAMRQVKKGEEIREYLVSRDLNLKKGRYYIFVQNEGESYLQRLLIY